jgi:hypothetical protein
MPLTVFIPGNVLTPTVRFRLMPAVDFTVKWSFVAPDGADQSAGTSVASLEHGPLAPATSYTLVLAGGNLEDGRPIALSAWHFSTVPHRVALPLLLINSSTGGSQRK